MTPNMAARAAAAPPFSCAAALLSSSNGQESPGLRVALQWREVMAEDMLAAAAESNFTWQESARVW
jgi:hypothetical protein